MKMIAQFGRGVPHDEVLKKVQPLIDDCTQDAALKYGLTLSRYATPGLADFLGLLDLRRQIAQRFLIPAENAERVVVSNGGMEGLFWLLFALRKVRAQKNKPVLLVEAMTYNRLIDIAISLGYNVVGVPFDEDGVDLQELDALCKQHSPTAFYQISPHGNPTGVTTSLSSLQLATQICESYNVLQILDSAYQDMRYDGEKNSILNFSNGGNFAVCGSFSKTIEPGSKCGYVILPENTVLRKAFQNEVSNGRLNPNYRTQGMIAVAMQTGKYNLHVNVINGFYGKRAKTMAMSIRTFFPETTDLPFWTAPNGGGFSFVLVKGLLPKQEEDYRHKCLGKGVALEEPTFFAPGFYELMSKKYGGVFYRLTFLSLDENNIVHGLEVMRDVKSTI